MRKRSKYVGQTFAGGWRCTAIYLAANYSGGTKHNAYRYKLVRITSDGKCDKIMSVSGNTMTLIANGVKTAESVLEYKEKSTRQINEITYKFI